jgi:hypothetical protein
VKAESVLNIISTNQRIEKGILCDGSNSTRSAVINLLSSAHNTIFIYRTFKAMHSVRRPLKETSDNKRRWRDKFKQQCTDRIKNARQDKISKIREDQVRSQLDSYV